MQAPPTTGTPQGSEGGARRGAEYLGQHTARRQLPPGAAYAPQHAPAPAPPPPQPPRRLVESPVNYSRPLSVSPAPPPPPQQQQQQQQQHSNSAPPALHTRRSFIGPSHLASPSSSPSTTTPAPSPNGAPSTRTAAASGMSLASQLPSFVPAVAFSPEDRGPYPPLASPTRELREPASAVADYLDAATTAAATAAQGASSSSAAAAAPRVGLDDLDMAGVGTRASLILPSSFSGAPTPSSSSGAPVPLLSPPRTGAPTPARSPQLVAASPYASAPSASAALVSASASPVGAPPPPLAPPATPAQAYAAPPGAQPPKPPGPPQPPPHLVAQPEVCVECMMRDRDMADVDVTGARVWERDSDAEWDEQCRWEDQVELLGAGAGAGAGSGSGHEAHGGGNGSSESGAGAGVRRSVYERESSSAHTGAGAGAGGRRRLGKGQLLTSGNLKVWTTMNPPAAAHRWRTLQTFLATQAHYLELDRQARIREASAAAAAAASSSPHGPSPIEHLPAVTASTQPRNRASSLLSPESLAAEKAALEHEERVALRAIKSRSRATLADETNLHQHQHQHQFAGGNQSFRHSSASLLPPPSLYNGVAGGNGGGGNASSGSSMRSYSAGDQPWLGPALRRLSSPSAAGAPAGAGAGASQLSASPPKSPATSMASSRFAFPKFARSSTDLRSLPPGGGTGGGGGATPRSVSPARTSGDGSARRPTSMWSRFRQSASAASVLSFAPSGSMMDMHLGLEQDQRAGLAAAGGPGYGSLGHYGGGGGGAAMYAAQHGAGAGAGAGYGFGSPQQAVYDAYGAAAMSDPAVARHADRRERERVLAETAAAREAAAAAAAAEAEHGAGKKKKKGLKGFFNKLVGGGGGGGRARSRTLGSSSAPATPGVDRGAPFDASLGPGSRYGADDDELAPPPPLSALANEPRYHLRSGSSSSVDSLGPYTPPLPPQQQFRQSYHMPMHGGGAHAADRQSVLTLGSFTSTRSNGGGGGGGGGNKPSSGAGARASTVPSRNSWVGRPSLDSVRRPGSFGGGPALGGGGGGPGDAETEVLAGGVDDLDLEPEQQHGDDEHELLQPPPHPRSQKSLPLLPSEATYRGSPSPHGASSPYDPYHAARAGPSAGYDVPEAGPYGNYGASRSAYTLGSNPAADSRASLAQEFGLVGDQEQQHTVRKSRSRHKVFSLSFGSNSGKKGQHRQSSAEVGPPPPPSLPQPSAARGASLDSSSVMRYAEAYDGRPQGEALVGGMR
ncbi:hypothetical protein JCM9279_002662 [Rhodotorula babjevae]